MDRRTFLAVLLGLGVAPRRAYARRPRLYGPMIGHVSPTTASIWIYAGGATDVRVYYRKEGTPRSTARAVTGLRGNRVTLAGLEPATRYVYRVVFHGHTEPFWAGSFATPPRPGTPLRFRMAVTSCMKHDHPFMGGFTSLLAQKPDLHLMLGDNVYADSTVRSRIWDHYLRMRSISPFAEILRQVPNYAVWDDHDFAGDNIGGAEVPQRHRLLEIFEELWANPSYGTPQVPGAFFQLTRGDVDVFVLDGRYYRSALGDANGSAKRMIGDGQFAWFADRIRRSKAAFKLIASGSTLAIEGTDVWQNYQYDRNRIWKLIRDERIGGVIWLSGDLHEGVIEVHPTSEVGFYPLYEVISSGIANSRDHEFAILDFDTTVEDPTCVMRILDGHGKLGQEERVTRSMLQVAQR